MTATENWLDSLKPGDEVFVSTSHPDGTLRVEVESVDSRKIRVRGSEAAFRRSDGSCISWTGFGDPMLHPLTDDDQMREWLISSIATATWDVKMKSRRRVDGPSISQLHACLAYLRSAKESLDG